MPCDDVFTTIHTLVNVSRDDQKRPKALQGIQVFPARSEARTCQAQSRTFLGALN